MYIYIFRLLHAGGGGGGHASCLSRSAKVPKKTKTFRRNKAMLVAADGTLIRKLSRSEAVEFGRREALKLKDRGDEEAQTNWKFVSKVQGSISFLNNQWTLEGKGWNSLGYKRLTLPSMQRDPEQVPWEKLRRGNRRVLKDGDLIGLFQSKIRLTFVETPKGEKGKEKKNSSDAEAESKMEAKVDQMEGEEKSNNAFDLLMKRKDSRRNPKPNLNSNYNSGLNSNPDPHKLDDQGKKLEETGHGSADNGESSTSMSSGVQHLNMNPSFPDTLEEEIPSQQIWNTGRAKQDSGKELPSEKLDLSPPLPESEDEGIEPTPEEIVVPSLFRTNLSKRSRPTFSFEENWSAKGARAKRARSKTNLKIISWNANGFGTRLINKEDSRALNEFLGRENPDVMCIQEVNLPAKARVGSKKGDGKPRQRDKIGALSTKAMRDREQVQSSLRRGKLAGYKVHWSLADWKYSGTAMLIKKGLKVDKIANIFPGEEGPHDEEGRLGICVVEGIEIWTTYVPNSGWTPESHKKRKDWDARILAALTLRSRQESKMPLVWVGDMNVCKTDEDASHVEFFRHKIYNIKRKLQVPHDLDEKGQPGVIIGEQKRFAKMLVAGSLVDSYRIRHPNRDTNKDLTWRGSPPVGASGNALYYGKGMRIDYALVSSSIKDKIISSYTCGRGANRQGFLGSDHCPIVLNLHWPG